MRTWTRAGSPFSHRLEPRCWVTALAMNLNGRCPMAPDNSKSLRFTINRRRLGTMLKCRFCSRPRDLECSRSVGSPQQAGCQIPEREQTGCFQNRSIVASCLTGFSVGQSHVDVGDILAKCLVEPKLR